jgi:hypothetical protein
VQKTGKTSAKSAETFSKRIIILDEPVAKPHKGRTKPMGQDVHVCRKISNVAASAASTIVHCQLSIVNF